uniref:alginate lyase family protein n=1 Tax=Janthinobacterium sp. TaxID=1871054 RepID=UPI00293D2408
RDSVDPAAEARARTALAPLRAFTQEIVRGANRYRRDGNPAEARCVLARLDAWAGAGGLARMDDANAQFERAGALAAFSLALLQIAPAVEQEPRYAAVLAWMHGLAASMTDYYSQHSSLKSARNNHRDWAGLAAAGVAVLSGDRALLDWSAATYQAAVCGADARGGLPLELARGKKARDYHLFALSALVPLAAILEDNGVAAFAACDGALHRIVRFSLAALAEPSAIAALAGAEQEAYPGGLPPRTQIAFLELYSRRFPGRAPREAELLALRPLYSTNLGGDQGLLYAR